MNAIPVIAIFDVGKTNKKLFLFDESYKIVYEKSARFIETYDEDGFPCENIESLRLSVFDSLAEVFRLKQFIVKAVNFSAYGASFVYVGQNGNPLTPLYNYLKPYPAELTEQFNQKYGDENVLSSETASPFLGSLNSGMQLYRLKNEQPEVFKEVKYALHLPQYLSFLLTGKFYSDITSIGCHTRLWDFTNGRYHEWVEREALSLKLAPILRNKETLNSIFPGSRISVGIGFHDSSAALVPYLVNFHEPFILISTGTWSISLNPFNQEPLSIKELSQDCLCYLQYEGKPVKASRVFLGFEYEKQLKRISEHYGTNIAKYRQLQFDANIYSRLNLLVVGCSDEDFCDFESINLSEYKTDIEAYYKLVAYIIRLQVRSTNLILKGTHVGRIFVDGGFGRNNIFMNLLATAFPHMEVFAASMAQSTALGAAIAIHNRWNTKPLPRNLIELNYYGSANVPINED